MKKLKSAVAFFLTLGLTLTSFIGCHGKDSGDWDVIINETQTQLYVSNLNGGIGYEWLNKVKQRFETAYAEESFETGKKGVQVIIDTENQVNGAWLIIPNSSWDVYFNENLPFNDYVSQNQLLDISDVVKAPAYGETETIESKLTDDQKASITAYDGKYYVLPHYEAYRGLSYNVKVFEDNKLFFAENKDNGNGGFVVSAKDKRSLGPNGKTGVIDGVDYSYDDGLPATVDEFFALCDRMVMVGVTPFVWPGAAVAYSEYIVDAFAEAFSGSEQLGYNFSIDSGIKTTEVVTGFNGNTPVTEKVTISNENGYMLRRQAAKYYGYAVFAKIIENLDKYVYSLSDNNSTFTQYDSQEEFLAGEFENKPIGMIADGNYWWNESIKSGAYQRTVNQFGGKAEEKSREFAWMPLPGVWSATDGETPVTEPVLKDAMKSYCFVNADIKNNPGKVKAAKAFVSFCYSDESLQEFTVTTGVAKGLDYELTTEQENSLASLGKSCWTLRKSCNVVRLLSSNRLFIENQGDFTTNLHTSVVNGQAYLTPFTAFKAKVSAREYFMGNWTSESDWNKNYSKYFTEGY